MLQATQHLVGEKSKLEVRMHALEDALAIAHATTSDGTRPHPLLENAESDHDEEEQPALKSVVDDPNEPRSQLADALGTLYIEKDGGSRFFGPSGGAEVCLPLPAFLFCLIR